MFFFTRGPNRQYATSLPSFQWDLSGDFDHEKLSQN